MFDSILFGDVAVQVIAVILVLLLLLFAVLIIYTLINRFVISRREVEYEYSESYVEPMIYGYLSDEIDRDKFGEGLRNTYDIIVAYRFLNTMIDNLDGADKKKLKHLLDLEVFKNYFMKDLRSNKSVDLSQACMYFAQKEITDEKAVTYLKPLQHHIYPVIVYASTFALLNVDNQKTRDHALRVFLSHRNNASMAVTDLVFKYVNKHKDYEQASQTLMKYASDPYIPVSTAASLINMFPQLGFIHLADDLYTELTGGNKTDYTGEFLSALIYVLGEFMHPKLGSYIRKKRYWKSDYQMVRLAVARWLQQNPHPNIKDILIDLVQDSDMEVRFAAMKAALQLVKPSMIEGDLKPAILEEWKQVKEAGEVYVDRI